MRWVEWLFGDEPIGKTPIAPLSAAEATEAKFDIAIKSEPEDVPEFKRVYSARLDERAKIEIEIYTMWADHRYKGGTLRQPNGNRVYFDPDHIAEKILDPLLVPLVQRCVDEIYALDRAFMQGDPGEYVDERGVTWRRA